MNGETPNPMYQPPGRIERFAAFFGELLEYPMSIIMLSDGSSNTETLQKLELNKEDHMPDTVDTSQDQN